MRKQRGRSQESRGRQIMKIFQFVLADKQLTERIGLEKREPNHMRLVAIDHGEKRN